MGRKILSYLGRDISLWLIGLVTGWLPDNLLTCKLRGALARPFFRQCGRNFQFGLRVRFLKPGRIRIGRDVYIAEGCWISGSADLTIDDEVMFGPYAMVVTANHSMKDGSVRFGAPVGAPVVIGRGSWIGAHVVILPGVTIGRGCIVASNAVVTRDVPDHTIVGGVPAKIIKTLDPDHE